ncbi:MAG: hypothetical protein AB7F78_19065, partial [Hyphomicrobiaceae bacterium]
MGERFGHGLIRGAAALALAALAGGCAGESGSTLLASGVASTGSSAGAATDDKSAYGISTESANQPFNPFAPEGSTDRPLREVIAKPTLADVLKPGALP